MKRVLVSRPEKTWPQTENLFNQIPFLRESPDQDSSSFKGIFSALPSGGLSYSLALNREGSGPGINLRFSATEIPDRQYFLDIDALCGQIWQSGNQPSGKRDITFDQAPDGIYLLSPDTLLIRETNHVFCQMLGFPDKQFFVGTPVTEWWNESEPEIRSLINRLSRTNTRSLPCRQRYSRMDGSHFLSDSTITFVTDSGQQSLLVHVRDISKEYELETINKISVELDQLILNDAPIEKLLQTVIGHLTNGFTFQIVHVATPTPEGTFSFLGIDRHPDQPGYRSLKDAMMASNRWDRGAGRQTSYGLATETGNSVFLTGEALENDPLFPQYLSLGIASVFSIPVANKKKKLPWAVLTVADQNINDLSPRVQKELTDLGARIRLAFARHESITRIRIQNVAMESSTTASVILYPDGTVEWANQAFQSMTGYSFPAGQWSDLSDIFPAPVPGQKGSTLQDLISEGSSFEGEIKGKNRQGNRFIAETVIIPLKNEQGSLIRMLIQQKDVTEERAIEQIDRLLSTLDMMVLNGEPIGSLMSLAGQKVQEMVHPEGTIIFLIEETGTVTEKIQHTASAELGEVLNHCTSTRRLDIEPLKGLPEEALYDAPKPANEMVQAGIRAIRRFRLAHNDRLWGYLVLFFHQEDPLDPPSLSRLEKLARRLALTCELYKQEEKRRLHQIAMESVSNGIMITDADGTVQWANNALLDMNGASPSDFLGKKPFILDCSDKERTTLSENHWTNLLSGIPFEGYLDDRKPDGSRYTVEATITPILDRGAVKSFVIIQKDQTLRLKQEQEIWRLAHTDQLTGLLNRSALLERIEIETGNARRSGAVIPFLFIDLDGFKEINDSLGHPAGDFLLKTVSARIRSSLRTTDIVARLGGDEFVVLLIGYDKNQDLMPCVEKINHHIAEPVLFEGHFMHVSGSIGVALFPIHGQTGQEVLRQADHAMYQAKHLGKNRSFFASPKKEKA